MEKGDENPWLESNRRIGSPSGVGVQIGAAVDYFDMGKTRLQ